MLEYYDTGVYEFGGSFLFFVDCFVFNSLVIDVRLKKHGFFSYNYVIYKCMYMYILISILYHIHVPNLHLLYLYTCCIVNNTCVHKYIPISEYIYILDNGVRFKKENGCTKCIQVCTRYPGILIENQKKRKKCTSTDYRYIETLNEQNMYFALVILSQIN